MKEMLKQKLISIKVSGKYNEECGGCQFLYMGKGLKCFLYNEILSHTGNCSSSGFVLRCKNCLGEFTK